MLRVLATRRWIAWLLVALVAAVACLFLGRWQWSRWESRNLTQTTIKNNYDATPVPLGEVLPTPTSELAPQDQWRQVRLVGSYDTGAQTLVRNRPLSGTYGYEVVLPFRADDGRTVLVDRGWVPNGTTAETPPEVPPAPSGQVTVVGWMRPAEPDLKRDAVPGQVSSINPPLVEQQTGVAMDRSAYVRMGSEQPSPAERPAQLGRPDLGSAAGINLSYALQWWLAMIAFPVLVLLAARRELPGRAERAPRPKKQRIWDEEDA